ncbi:MAG: hypothetical protein ISS93_03015, partial [Candidatus Aenigmarchaeota archaeon]|nr:hypothetical protein [Candidatus Aenigmarchaeota archaeon]
MKQLFLGMLLMLVLLQGVSATELNLSVGQKDYYFGLGQEAAIPLGIYNGYDKDVSGVLSMASSQQLSEGGFQYSNTNSNSKSFTFGSNHSTVMLDLGASNQPMDVVIDVSFQFINGSGDTLITELRGIQAHFVDNPSQQGQQQEGMQSSSESVSEKDERAKQEALEQKLEEMQEQPEQGQMQQMQEQQQNSQIPQDSNALKREMQEQIRESEELGKELEKKLGESEELSQKRKELEEQGFKQTGKSINPETNDTGSFEMQFQREDGEAASIKGKMENGEVTDLETRNSVEEKAAAEKLENSEEFIKMHEQLMKEGFNNTGFKVEKEGNLTKATVEYTNPEGEKAAVTATIEDDVVKEVELEREWKPDLLFFVLVIIAVLVAVFWWRRKKSRERKAVAAKEPKKVEKPFDYIAASLGMLDKAEKLFSEGSRRDAYGIAGQALRLFLRYKNGLKKELSNDDIIKHLRSRKKHWKQPKECFDL